MLGWLSTPKNNLGKQNNMVIWRWKHLVIFAHQIWLHPGRLTWNIIAEVCFRSFSFLNGWLVGSMLILPRCIFGCKKKNHPNQTPQSIAVSGFLIITQSAIYKWYISGIFPANWVIIYHRSHLSREPETAIDPGLLPTNSTSQAVKGGAFNPITGEAIGDRGLDATVGIGDRVQPGTPGRVGRPPPGADFGEGWLVTGWLVGWLVGWSVIFWVRGLGG